MRLLLTRPAEDAARTGEKLEARGHVVFISPVIEIFGTGATCPDGVVDAVLATSRQAFVAVDDNIGIAPEARRLMPMFLVGHRTAELAREQGFLGPQTVAPTAATLAAALENLAEKPKRLVYLAGRERKPDIETALDVSGRQVEVVEVYDARPVATLDKAVADALRSKRIDGVLHFSRRSASLFTDLGRASNADFASLTHFCLSEDVATPLRDAGCATIRVSEAPNEPALLALVDQA